LEVREIIKTIAVKTAPQNALTTLAPSVIRANS
jgi:hypothetical protein